MLSSSLSIASPTRPPRRCAYRYPSGALAVAVLAMLLAACGDDSNNTPSSGTGTSGTGSSGTGSSGIGGATNSSSASGSSAGGNSAGGAAAGGNSAGGAGPTPQNDVRAFFYGHSLVDFGVANSQVGSAMCEVAATSSLPCCASGDYPNGLAPSAFAFYPWPPNGNQSPQPNCWGGWQGSFGASNINTVVITEANFLWQGPADDSISAGAALVDTIRGADPDIPIYLYEHWPEFGGNITFESWHSSDNAGFHAWFAAIQDGINSGLNTPAIRLVPVGRVFATLASDAGPLAALSEADLFVDSDPHGTPSSYFISGLIHNMALYRQRPPSDAAAIAALPSYIHQEIRDNYAATVATAWSELNAVTDANNQSRVW